MLRGGRSLLSRGAAARGTTRNFGIQEKDAKGMIEVPSHYGWTAQQFEGMDSWEVQAHIKADMVMTEVLKIPKEKQAAFKQTYEISEGHWSLEWCHPSPMPFHTYTDGAHLPIIKEIGEKH